MPTKQELEKENAELRADLISLGDEVRRLREENKRLDSALSEAQAEAAYYEEEAKAAALQTEQLIDIEELIVKEKYYNRPITASALEDILY